MQPDTRSAPAAIGWLPASAVVVSEFSGIRQLETRTTILEFFRVANFMSTAAWVAVLRGLSV